MKFKNINPYDVWGILTIALIILKLLNVINISWLFVFTPIYLWLVLEIVVLILFIRVRRRSR